ncbi:MAG TPA: hypothetical protein VNH11_29535 [Pirellulales bacterium]|nr:hypothetical protein [Pirellulales bacterium]
MPRPRLRHWPLWLACGAVIALAIWARPRRTDALVTLDGRERWLLDDAAPMRLFAWQPGEALSDLLPPRSPPDEVSHPSLADDGATLYLTVRRAEGDADIYRSHWQNGRWQPAAAVTELNTPWDENGVAVSADGKQLYLASNRRGGKGGFDIYVSQRRASGWGVPKNLGDAVNTPANEYDPALAADGRQLYFASDRGTQTATTDLFVARRTASNRAWSEAAPLVRANSPVNERSPCLAEDGAVLYFSSDRQHRRGEKDFDLYRLRLHDDAAAVESLGQGINTVADETDPAVSPDGLRVTFARSEGRSASIYQSRLAEVERIAVWDTSRWQALRAVWWKALLATAALVALIAVVYFSAGWVRRRASMARFLAASLLLHAVVLWLMFLVPLSQEIVKRIEEIRVTSAAELFDDNLHQSHLPGEQVYEKVADLKSVEATFVPPVERRVTAPTNIPLHADTPAPTLPVELARRLPADRVIFVPPPRAASNAAAEVERRLEATVRVAQIDPQVAGPPPKVASPQEQAIQKQVELERAASALMTIRDAPATEQPLPGPVKGPVATQPAYAEPTDGSASVVALPPRRADTMLSAAQLDPEVVPLATVEKAAEKQVLERERPEVISAVTVIAPPKLSADEAMPASTRVAVTIRQIKSVPAEPQSTQPAKIDVPREVALAKLPAKLPDEPPPNLTRVDATPEKAIAPATVMSPAAPPSVPRPIDEMLEAGGPRLAGKKGTVVGTLAEQAVEAPPSLSPLATQLQRAAARAMPVAVADDNVGMRAMFALRQGDTRREFIDLVGGNQQTEEAVKRGLVWLAEHQHTDGHWSLHQLDPPEKKLPATSGAGNTVSDAAATGLGLLPFLAAGHTQLAGDYRPTVARAVEWLIGRQKPDGNLFVDGASNAFMYSHGIAAIALCEAYGMSQDERLRGPAQRALDFIVAAQHAGTGGWRYQPGEAGDTSVVGWQVMALKSGEMAGLTVPKAALDLASKWLDASAGTGQALGTFGYQGPGSSPAMTAEGLLCRQFLGIRRNDPALLAGAKFLLDRLPQAGQETSYYWYYATQVMYHLQGDHWTAWNERLRDLLVSSQIKEGHTAGTWDPHDGWEQSGGRLYATSLRLLMLEVYYRHLPLYQSWE